MVKENHPWKGLTCNTSQLFIWYGHYNSDLIILFYFVELRLMFSLMDRVPDGITPMLHDLEAYIVSQGLADMIAAAETITTVSQ